MIRILYKAFAVLWLLVSTVHAQSDYTWQRITSRSPFLERDGAGMVAYNSKLWLLGGWNPFEFKPNGVTNEIWSTPDGHTWTFEGNAPWSARHIQGSVVFQDKMWILCGDNNDGTYKNDVWNSSDGIHWTRVLDNAPWGNRVSPYVTVFNDKIWLMGGEQFLPMSDTVYNDVWNSADGVVWDKVLESAPWAPRSMIQGSAILNDKIWIFGGGKYNEPQIYYHDVWSSSDGIVWDSVNASPPWTPRAFVNIASFDNKLWVLDGYNNGDRNDVWCSPDGIHWSQLLNTPWPARHAASVAVFDSSLWITAGRLWNDVWRLKKNTLVITSPAGGSVKADTVVSVLWKSSLSSSVSLDYSADSGATWSNIASGIPALQENYSWHRSINDPAQIKLRIRSDDDLAFFDIINLDFEKLRPQQGLSAFYMLNANVKDASGNELDGIDQNVLPSTDRFGNESGSVSFDGSSSLAVLPAQSYTPFTNDFTISFWEKAYTLTPSAPLSIGSFQNNLDILFNAGGIGLWPFWNGAGENGIKSLTYPGQYTDNQWHHIVLTKRDDRVQLFVDGNYKFQTVYTNSIGETDYLILGQSSNSSSNWNGSLDELRIYNRSLNDQEILSIYNFVNHPPILSSFPDTFLTVNTPFSYTLQTVDPDTTVFGDRPFVHYVEGPAWLRFDSLSNTVSGIPKIQNTGDTSVVFLLQDLYGSSYLKTITLNVSYPNSVPYFVNHPDTVAHEDSLYTWVILTGDSEIVNYGDQVKFTLLWGPVWLTLDTLSGIVNGTPAAMNVGDTVVAVRIFDWMHAYTDKIFSVSIKHTNHPPVIHTEFLPAAQEDSLYEYAVTATDTDSLLFGDVLHYSLSVSPVWLSIDSISGRLSGMPLARDLGDTVVTVHVTDGQGGEAIRTYALHIAHTNHAPYWVTDPDTLAKEGLAYHSRVLAGDVDSSLYGDYLRYRLLYGPVWLTLDSISGILSGIPPNNSDGDTVAQVLAADLAGTTIYKEWHIRVLPTNYSPSYVSTVYPLFHDTLTLFKIPIQRIFRWTSSVDPDNQDTVRYVFHLKGANLDTVIAGLSDTTVTLNGGLLAEQEFYRWYVDATDGEFIVTPPDTFTFQTTKRMANLTYTELPQTFKLFQNYPNPFNPSTTIRFQIPERSKVKIEAYNILGQFVQKIFEGNLDTKYYEVEWSPRSMASGIYIVRFSAEGILSRKQYRSVKKMIYLK